MTPLGYRRTDLYNRRLPDGTVQRGLLNCSRSRVYLLEKSGRLRAVKVAGVDYFKMADLEALLAGAGSQA
jgi:hypothetical protein